MIKINIIPINKSEKKIWVKSTAKRIGHYRRIKGAEKTKEKYYSVTNIPEYDKEISIIMNDLDAKIAKGLDMQTAIYEVIGKPKSDSLSCSYANSYESNIVSKELFTEKMVGSIGKLNMLLSEKVKGGMSRIVIVQQPYKRSNQVGNIINIQVDGDNEVHGDSVVHEYGHYLELKNKNIRDTCNAFHDARCAGEEFVKLNDLFPKAGYRDNEVTQPDNFIDAYSGRVYIIQNMGKVVRTDTEILSTGLAKMITKESQEEFYKSDKEHFGLILTIMAGKIL